MKVKDLYDLTSESFIFINLEDAGCIEYYGQDEFSEKEITHITATKYPMYNSVLEIEIK